MCIMSVLIVVAANIEIDGTKYSQAVANQVLTRHIMIMIQIGKKTTTPFRVGQIVHYVCLDCYGG